MLSSGCGCFHQFTNMKASLILATLLACSLFPQMPHKIVSPYPEKPEPPQEDLFTDSAEDWGCYVDGSVDTGWAWPALDGKRFWQSPDCDDAVDYEGIEQPDWRAL